MYTILEGDDRRQLSIEYKIESEVEAWPSLILEESRGTKTSLTHSLHTAA